jgi:antitoxin FitA
MASITIPNIPDQVRDELASRAASTGRSLQDYLRSELLKLVQRPDPALLLDRIRERKRLTNSTLSADQILSLQCDEDATDPPFGELG